MAFRQIGIPARKVIDRIESERAAVKVAQEFVGGPKAPGGAAIDPPVARHGEGPAGAQRDGKKAGAETPASDAQGSVRQTAGRGGMRLVASLPVGRGLGTAQSARAHSPCAAVPRPMLTVVGGLDHAASPSASA